MAQTASRLGLAVETTAVDGAGSWVRNAALKPSFLLNARKSQRGPLLYVDVDAVFHKDPWPVLAEIDAHLGVFYSQEGNLISATIYLSDTPEVVDLLLQWKIACDNDPEIWDQVTLQEILSNTDNAHLTVERLPVSFCWVFDRFKNGQTDEVYIEQLQASRQATSKKRLFGRRTKRLVRRDERIKEIEKILASDP